MQTKGPRANLPDSSSAPSSPGDDAEQLILNQLERLDHRWWIALTVAIRKAFSLRRLQNPRTKRLIRGTGAEADFLRQLCYWQMMIQSDGSRLGIYKDGLRWIWITYDELESQLGITRQRIADTKRNLCLLGLLKVKQHKKHSLDWTNHYAIRWDRVFELCPLESASPDSGNGSINGSHGISLPAVGNSNHPNESRITSRTTSRIQQSEEREIYNLSSSNNYKAKLRSPSIVDPPCPVSNSAVEDDENSKPFSITQKDINDFIDNGYKTPRGNS